MSHTRTQAQPIVAVNEVKLRNARQIDATFVPELGVLAVPMRIELSLVEAIG